MDNNQYVPDNSQPDDLQVTWVRTRCMVCGFVYEGKEPLVKCPKCGNEDPDKFEEVE